MPHDGNSNNLATLIRWDELTRNADLIRAKHILFIMDACYGGLALTRQHQAGSTRFLKDMLLRHSRQVLTAGKANEVVADAGGPLPDHSIFTGHLIEGLRGNAATAEGIITASGLMAYVYGKVANDRNSNQTPHYGYFDGDGDFIFRAPGITALEAPDNKGDDRLISIPYPLEDTQPQRTKDKVQLAKKLLANDSSSIELHDFLVTEVRQFLAATSEDNFTAHGQFSQEEMQQRLTRYEEVATDTAIVLACTCHWAKASHKHIIQKVIARSADRLEQRSGLNAWLSLQWYPLILEMYYAGLASVYGQRFDSLATIFYTPIPSTEHRRETKTFAESADEGLDSLRDSNIFKSIPGHERYYVPASEYLFKILQPGLDDALFLGKDYEQAFDAFEVFFALATADLNLVKNNNAWGPIGRFAWKRNQSDAPLARIISEGRAQKGKWPPLSAGLFDGSYERFDAAATAYLENIKRLNWY